MPELYSRRTEATMTTTVSTTEYRANLKHWHRLAQQGQDILVTDRHGVVVRVSAAGASATLDRLQREGLLRRGRSRPQSAELERVSAPGDSAAGISADRDR